MVEYHGINDAVRDIPKLVRFLLQTSLRHSQSLCSSVGFIELWWTMHIWVIIIQLCWIHIISIYSISYMIWICVRGLVRKCRNPNLWPVPLGVWDFYPTLYFGIPCEWRSYHKMCDQPISQITLCVSQISLQSLVCHHWFHDNFMNPKAWFDSWGGQFQAPQIGKPCPVSNPYCIGSTCASQLKKVHGHKPPSSMVQRCCTCGIKWH